LELNSHFNGCRVAVRLTEP